MTERRYRFAKGTPFTLEEIGHGQVIFRFTYKGTGHEHILTPARAGQLALKSFTDPEGLTTREQMLLHAWCLGQTIVAAAMPSGGEPGAESAASLGTNGTGAPASQDQPVRSPQSAPVSSSRNPATSLLDALPPARSCTECG